MTLRVPQLPPEFKFLSGKILSSRVYPEFFTLEPNSIVFNAGFGEGPQAIVYKNKFLRMKGMDIQEHRLNRVRTVLANLGINNLELTFGDVESTGEISESYDAVLAIDIIEHVQHPDLFCNEMFRILKPGGRMLITFPAMHDRFEHAMTALGKIVKPWKHRKPHTNDWHPDNHAHDFSVAQWGKIVSASGFVHKRSRATTLFPPLHLYGIPRFWFSWNWLHAFDSWLCNVSWFQDKGQAVLAEFQKPTK